MGNSSILKIYGLVEAIEYLENLKTKYTSEDIRLQFWLAQVSHYNDKKLYRNIIEIVNKSLISYKDNINLVYARAMAYEALKKVDLMEKDLLFILSIDNKLVSFILFSCLPGPPRGMRATPPPPRNTWLDHSGVGIR